MQIIMKYLIIILFTLVFQMISTAQCPESGYQVFTSDSEIDDFVSNYPECHKLDSLFIANPDIVDLSFIGQLDSIGVLSLTNVGIKDLSFLENISILDKVNISSNDSLNNQVTIPYKGILNELIYNNNATDEVIVDAIRLDEITVNNDEESLLTVMLNPAIDSIIGVKLKGNIIVESDNIIDLSGGIIIGSNSNYSLFTKIFNRFDFDDIVTFIIHDMDYFSFDGLTKNISPIQFILSDINTVNIPEEELLYINSLFITISNISNGISDLRLFSEADCISLELDNVYDLINLDHLKVSNLGSIYIQNNPNLDNIDQIAQAGNIKFANGFTIQNNPKLSNCSVESICNKLLGDYEEEYVILNNNMTGCNSIEEILEKCVVGTSDIPTGENKLDVIPNPSLGNIKLNFVLEESSNVSIIISDMMGRILNTIDYPSKFSSGLQEVNIDLDHLNSGNYIVIVIDSQKEMIGRKIFTVK